MRDPGPSLVEAAYYIERFRDQLVVVKLGGELQVGERPVARIAAQIEILHRCGLRPVVVHGGGAQIDATCRERGIAINKVAGRRVTSAETMEVVLDVVAGTLNRTICERLAARDVPVRGFDDGLQSVLRCTLRPPVEIDGQTVDFGEVGDVDSVDRDAIISDPWQVPVLPSVGVLDDGRHVNVNADTVAARVAVAMSAQKLVMMSSVPGVMTRPDAAGPISQLDEVQARALIADGNVAGGMRAKVEEALRALAGGVEQVHVISGVEPHTLLHEVFTEEGCGTLMTRGIDA